MNTQHYNSSSKIYGLSLLAKIIPPKRNVECDTFWGDGNKKTNDTSPLLFLLMMIERTIGLSDDDDAIYTKISSLDHSWASKNRFLWKYIELLNTKVLRLYTALLNWILTEDNEIKALNCLIWPYAMYLRLTLQSWI